MSKSSIENQIKHLLELIDENVTDLWVDGLGYTLESIVLENTDQLDDGDPEITEPGDGIDHWREKIPRDDNTFTGQKVKQLLAKLADTVGYKSDTYLHVDREGASINPKNYETFIVLVENGVIERRDAECVWGKTFESQADLEDELGVDPDNMKVYSMLGFMNEFNDQNIGPFTDHMTYVKLPSMIKLR